MNTVDENQYVVLTKIVPKAINDMLNSGNVKKIYTILTNFIFDDATKLRLVSIIGASNNPELYQLIQLKDVNIEKTAYCAGALRRNIYSYTTSFKSMPTDVTIIVANTL